MTKLTRTCMPLLILLGTTACLGDNGGGDGGTNTADGDRQGVGSSYTCAVRNGDFTARYLFVDGNCTEPWAVNLVPISLDPAGTSKLGGP